MIEGLSEAGFTEILYSQLSPARPISTAERLKGRDKTLDRIRQALLSPGRQIFIYGDRGVGKTSLAKTAAHQHQSSDANPITLECGSGFFQLMLDLYEQCTPAGGTVSKTTKVAGGLGPFASLSHERSSKAQDRPQFTSMNEVMRALKHQLSLHSVAPVVIFDEFDLLPTGEDKELFGHFVKQVADQELNAKIIYTGIGGSESELLNAHGSAFRYLETIQLKNLDIDGRMDIIRACADALGIQVGIDTLVRISAVSDGFPYYVHLIGEKMFWETYRDTEVLTATRAVHYVDAVKEAVVGIQAFLKRAWDLAVQKYGTNADSYQEILWAVTDDPHFERASADIFESYKRIVQQLGKDPLERKYFNQRLNRLKTANHGSILKGTRSGWYQFSENIVRGYVRMKAEEAGVPLEVDHHLLKQSKLRSIR